MEKTEWFPAIVDPVHVGLYECNREEISGRVTRFLFWTGIRWLYTDTSGFHQIGDPASLYPSDKDKWRGLTENPNAD